MRASSPLQAPTSLADAKGAINLSAALTSWSVDLLRDASGIPGATSAGGPPPTGVDAAQSSRSEMPNEIADSSLTVSESRPARLHEPSRHPPPRVLVRHLRVRASPIGLGAPI